MDNDNKTEEVAGINLSEIDWNNLSIKKFNEIERHLQQEHNEVKIANRKMLKRSGGFINIKLAGDIYLVKVVLYQRLKKLKSPKSREKLINEIISTHNPIDKL